MQLQLVQIPGCVLREALRARSFGVVIHEVVSGGTPERRALPPLRHVLCSLFTFANAIASLLCYMLFCGDTPG